MGEDIDTVSQQLEVLGRQIDELHIAVARNEASMTGLESRMTGMEDSLAGMLDGLKKVMTIGVQRGYAAASERQPLTVVTDVTDAPAPGTRTRRRRRRAAALVCAAALAAAGIGIALWVKGDSPRAAKTAGGDGLAVSQGRDWDVPHGPPWYPVTPRPTPGVSGSGLSSGVSRSPAIPGPPVGGGAATGAEQTPRPGSTSVVPAMPLRTSPSPDCRFDLRIRRWSVCRAPAR